MIDLSQLDTMQCEVKIINDTAVVRIANKFLDAFTAKAFRLEVIKLCEQGHKNFVVDLSTVDFIDSAGIGVLLLLYKTLGKEGHMALACVCSNVDELLTIVSLKGLIPIYDTVDTALAAIIAP